MMLVWRDRSSKNSPCRRRSCFEFEQVLRFPNDLFSWPGPPRVYSNSYFALRMAETPNSSQGASFSFENGGWWWRGYSKETGVWITLIWCMESVWMISSQDARVKMEMVSFCSKLSSLDSSVQQGWIVMEEVQSWNRGLDHFCMMYVRCLDD